MAADDGRLASRSAGSADPASAPLISIPEAPAPRGARALWVTAEDGVRLRACLVPSLAAPRGTVVLSPGRTEPLEKYFEAIGELLTRGFGVVTHDWRGQGLSARALADPLVGHARGWRPYLADLARVLARAQAEDAAPRPWIALGHSMGGALTILAMLEGGVAFDGAVLSAPMLGVNPGRHGARAARWLVYAMQAFRADRAVAPIPDPLYAPFAHNVLTHDEGRFARFRRQLQACPQLRLAAFTWGWLWFALSLSLRVKTSTRVSQAAVPVAIVAAAEDRLVTNADARALAQRLPDATYVEVEGAFHELLMETDARRAVFWRAFDALADRVVPRGESTG